MASSSEDKPIGIDLGTTNSAAAWLNREQLEMILSETGARTIPSFAAFTAEKRLVGEDALAQAGENPANTIYEVKRLIGKTMEDSTVKEDVKVWPFIVRPDGEGKPQVHVSYKNKEEAFYPEQISSMVLSRLKVLAGELFRSPVKKVVITVPAAFNDAQRQATIDAGRIAGVEVLRIINEPTAAAIAYGYTNTLAKGQNRRVLVFDLGGGTFDVSILTMEKSEYNVISTLGDVHLGGGDFDGRLQTHFEKKFTGGNLEGNFRAKWRLRAACEKAKKELSTATRAFIELENLQEDQHLRDNITRAAFEDLCSDLFEKTIDITKECLMQANLTPDDIDDVVLVGGSTRIPKVRELVSEMFGEKKIRQSINPDEAVAQGAALQAALLLDKKDGESLDLVVKDQLPKSLGVNTSFGITSHILKKGQVIPVSNTKRYYTAEDDQEYVPIRVLEGESFLTCKNDVLDCYKIDVPPGPAHKEAVDVTFTVNADGVLEVMARSVTTGKGSGLRVQRSRKQFTDEEVNQYRETDEKMEEQNRKQTEQDRARDKLLALAYRLNKVVALKEKCDTILKWLDDKRFAEQQLLDERIEELAAIDAARQQALEEVENKAKKLHCQAELTEEVDNILSWLTNNRDRASEEEFKQKLEELNKLKKPSKLRGRLGKCIKTTRKTCKKYPKVLQKCMELEDWLNTCSSDTEENTFSDKIDELENFVEECVSDDEGSISGSK